MSEDEAKSADGEILSNPDLEVPELTEINMAHPPVSVLEDPSSTSSGFHTPATAPPVLNPTSSPVSPPIFQDSASIVARGETQPHFPPSRWEISSNIASILSTTTLACSQKIPLMVLTNHPHSDERGGVILYL